MKTLLTLFVLLFSSSVLADDISDFQIEGISIGDSLLDHFSEKFIKENEENYYKNKTYTPVEIFQHPTFKIYDSMSFNYKTGDNNFIVSHMSGRIKFNNNMEECEKKKEVILTFERIAKKLPGIKKLPKDDIDKWRSIIKKRD